VVLADSLVENAVAAVVKAAKTGKIGDGKVFVYPSKTLSGFEPRRKGQSRLAICNVHWERGRWGEQSPAVLSRTGL